MNQPPRSVTFFLSFGSCVRLFVAAHVCEFVCVCVRCRILDFCSLRSLLSMDEFCQSFYPCLLSLRTPPFGEGNSFSIYRARKIDGTERMFQIVCLFVCFSLFNLVLLDCLLTCFFHKFIHNL